MRAGQWPPRRGLLERMDCRVRAATDTNNQYHGGSRADECSRKALWTEAKASLPAKDLTGSR